MTELPKTEQELNDLIDAKVQEKIAEETAKHNGAMASMRKKYEDDLKKAKEQGIHTCLDTSAATYTETRREDFETLLKYTDLVLLDFKHSDSEEHKKLTGMTNDAPLAFAKLLDEKNGYPVSLFFAQKFG